MFTKFIYIALFAAIICIYHKIYLLLHPIFEKLTHLVFLTRMKKVLYCLLTFFLLSSLSVFGGTWTSGSTTVTTSGSTVTVSGSGAMADYNHFFDPSWVSNSITTIIINEGVTHIGAYAFIEATNVTSVTIPTSVTSIGESAFGASPKIARINYNGSPNEWASITFANNAANPFGDSDAASRNFYFHGCDFTTTTLTLSPGLERVNDYAFYNMKIANLNIPGSVEHIGNYAFSCAVSTSVCVNRATPPSAGTNAITYGSSAKLYVPSSAVSAYNAAGKPWKNASYMYGPGATGQTLSGTLNASYGEGVTWTLDEDGILTFDASSPSASKSITLGAGSSYPWGNFRRLVDKVRLRGEISALGNALAYHWFLRGVILDQNTIPTCSNNIAVSSIGQTAYNSLFNPCHPLTMQVKLSSLISPTETAKLGSVPWNDDEHWVVAIDEEVVIDENSTDNMELLEAVRTYIHSPFTMRLQRSVSNAYYNTFCSPIALTAEQVENTFGAGTLIHELASTTYDAGANELTLNFADSQDFMDAGVPYLLWPANNVVNPVFNDVEPAAVANAESTVNASHVDFNGTLEPRTVTSSEIADKSFIFLQADNQLNWANTGTLKGMRAFWSLTGNVPVRAIAKRPVMNIGSATTRIGEVPDNNEQCTKVLRDGQVIIIRDGNEYNIMGIRL